MMPEGWTTKRLGELFEKEDLKELEGIIKKKDMENLNMFLEKRKDALERKGIFWKYLYYYLEYAFEMSAGGVRL